MEDFIHFLQSKKQWFKICFLDFIMIKQCCGAKLSHVTLYARTATDGNMSVVEKGFFAVATSIDVNICRFVKSGGHEVGYGIDITE